MSDEELGEYIEEKLRQCGVNLFKTFKKEIQENKMKFYHSDYVLINTMIDEYISIIKGE